MVSRRTRFGLTSTLGTRGRPGTSLRLIGLVRDPSAETLAGFYLIAETSIFSEVYEKSTLSLLQFGARETRWSFEEETVPDLTNMINDGTLRKD